MAAQTMMATDDQSNSPYPVLIVEGEDYWWCACGKSKREPLCDGTHKGSGIGPVIIRADFTGLAQFCGCKKTKSPPYCDGSHIKAYKEGFY